MLSQRVWPSFLSRNVRKSVIGRKQLPPKPCLILIMGVAGSGKSTLSREIMRHIWAVYLDNNYIADAFFPNTRNGLKYKKLRPHFYKALYTIAQENLKLDNSVLLDVPHIKEVQTREWRAFLERLVARTKAKMVVIRCLCSKKTLHTRLCLRGQLRDRWKLKHWNQFLRKEPIEIRIPFPHLDINTEKDLLKNVKVAVQHILS
jgi:predicted kinase